KHERNLVVIDGKDGPPEGNIAKTRDGGAAIFFSPDSRRVVYVASAENEPDSYRLVSEGHRSHQAFGQQIDSARFNPHSSFILVAINSQCFSVNGETLVKSGNASVVHGGDDLLAGVVFEDARHF